MRRKLLRAEGRDLLTPMVQQSPSGMYNNILQPQPLGVSTGRNNLQSMRNQLVNRGKISQNGMRFLKCAFSAADFDGTGTYGVPDQFAGKSSAVKHRFVNTVNFAASRDTYFLVLPIPGYAYFFTSVAAGTPILDTTVFTGVRYSNYDSLFFGEPAVPGNASQNVTKFRFVSNHFELVPTTNAQSWTGSVQVWKLPLQFAGSQDVGTGDLYQTINGLEGTNTTNADMYSGPFNLGAYVGAFNKGSTAWEFSDIRDNLLKVPPIIAISDFGQLDSDGRTLPGFDNNHESVCIKVSGIGTNALDTALLRTWACVEYQFSPNNAMYDMQNLKGDEDRVALELYRKIILELPTAVSYLDNANFWTRVLQIIRQISGGLSFVPGPYGVMASGVNSIATGIESLTL